MVQLPGRGDGGSAVKRQHRAAVELAKARKLQPGAPASNRIAVWAESGQLRVFANGVEQFALQTRSDLSGALGVVAQGSGSTAATFRFPTW